MNNLFIYTDGASRGNPGEAAIAFLIYDSKGRLLREFKKKTGFSSNNEAEYKAIIEALSHAKNYNASEVVCFSDSLLVINQINGKWRIKKPHLKTLHSKVKEKEKLFKKVVYKHVTRNNQFISNADRMANEALDKE